MNAPSPVEPGLLRKASLRSGALATLVLAGCAVGPDYQRPASDLPAHYRSEAAGSWKEGTPLDNAPKGNWWELFGDATLNELQDRATGANLELKGAMARVEQVRATARVARSEQLPSLQATSGQVRQRFSPNQTPSFGDITASRFNASLDLSYEIDLWGRVRRGFESARADAQGSLALFHNVLLTLHADVAQTYFALRALDAEIATVQSTIGLRKAQVELVRRRFDNGVGNQLDVARAETELASAEAESNSLAKHRFELETALAILAGEAPTGFRLPGIAGGGETPWNPTPPPIPAGLPAALLERRPDISAAERQLAAANARIGIAKAAFYPVLRLTGSGGSISGDVESLFQWDSRVWSLGPGVSLPIFAGGRNRANHRRSQFAYEEAIAHYRQSILIAIGEVENSLAGIHFLTAQAADQERATAHARRAADLADTRFRMGLVSYFEVIDAGRIALQSERIRSQLTGQRLIASVHLIKALGGGWQGQEHW